MQIEECKLIKIVKGWIDRIKKDFKEHGYRSLAIILSVYIGVYAMLEAKHERHANRALFEQGTFMTMVSSGTPGAFASAMKNFSLLVNMTIPKEPRFWPPFKDWLGEYHPNKESLEKWAKSFFPQCVPEICGRGQQNIRIDLEGADLRDVDLSGIDISGVYLKKTIIDRANIPEKWKLVWSILNTKEKNRNLKGADLRYTVLIGANLKNSNLEVANLSNANLHGANLASSNLEGANLQGAILSESCLKNANIYGVDLSESNLSKANLEGVDIESSTIVNSVLKDSWLKKARIVDSELDGSNLENANLYKSVLGNSSFIRVNLENAIILEADISFVKLYKSNLKGAILAGSKLDRTVILSDANLESVDFDGSRVLFELGPHDAVKIDREELAEGAGSFGPITRLEGVDLTIVKSLKGAHLLNVDLSKTDVKPIQLDKTCKYTLNRNNYNNVESCLRNYNDLREIKYSFPCSESL